MNKAQRIKLLVEDLEMIVTRFTDEERKTANRHFGSQRNGHTELSDGFSWALGALERALPLVEDHPGLDHFKETLRAGREAEARIYNR